MPRAVVICADPGVPTDGPSGASHHLRAIARAFDGLGYETTIANLCRSDKRGAIPRPWTGAHLELAPKDWAGWGRLREVGEHVDGQRLAAHVRRQLGPVDVVWERFSLGGTDAHRLGKTHILEVNAPILAERQRYARVRSPAWVRQRQRRTLRRAGHVMAVSPWLHNWCTEQGAKHVRLLPNGTDVRPAPGPPTSAKLRIGFHGAFRAWHGLHRLPAILDELPEATCHLAGRGPAPEHPRIHHHGELHGDALMQWLHHLHVAVLPYTREAPPWFCPLKMADYRAAGVPMVVQNAGDLPALLGDVGAVVQTEEPAAWARAVRQLAGRRAMPEVRTWRSVVQEALIGAHGRTQAG